MLLTTADRLAPIDDEAPDRAARLKELGIVEGPDPELDEFARDLAHRLNAPFGMVNLIGRETQYLAGLYPSSDDRGVAAETDPFREMTCDHGFCRYVVMRKHAMALDEVLDFFLYAANPVVDKIGVRAYLGAPLIGQAGTLGTICVVDTEPRRWRPEDVEFIKAQAAELVNRIQHRAARSENPAQPPITAPEQRKTASPPQQPRAQGMNQTRADQPQAG